MGMPTTVDKTAIVEQLLLRLRQDLDVAVEAQRRTQQGATHEESRPENDKDTRAVESSYLARGQARRVVELESALLSLEAMPVRSFEPTTPVSVGALVWVADDETMWCYFIVPAGGGAALSFSGEEIIPVSLSSPVGRALLGKHQHDDVEFRSPGGLREWTIERVA